MKLSKFDVAERQLLQSIKLFFNEEDPVSIHTIAEASAQVLRNIGVDYGVKSITRDNECIKKDKRKEWNKELSKSRNFFKHADRDKNEFHEFDPMFNDFSLFDAAIMYNGIKKKWVPEVFTFWAWFILKYPELIREKSEIGKMYIVKKQNEMLPNPKTNKLFQKCSI